MVFHLKQRPDAGAGEDLPDLLQVAQLAVLGHLQAGVRTAHQRVGIHGNVEKYKHLNNRIHCDAIVYLTTPNYIAIH